MPLEKCITILFFAPAGAGELLPNPLKKIAKDSKYTLIWTTPYTETLGDKDLQKILNQKKAEDLWGFIE